MTAVKGIEHLLNEEKGLNKRKVTRQPWVSGQHRVGRGREEFLGLGEVTDHHHSHLEPGKCISKSNITRYIGYRFVMKAIM